MANIKITVDTGTIKYISNVVPGKGNSPENYNVSEALLAQKDHTNFPAFKGTAVEWRQILETASTTIENVGATQK